MALDKELAAVEPDIRAMVKKQALRCLKRRISDVIYRQLLADAEQRAKRVAG